MSGRVREYQHTDTPAVAELWMRVFRGKESHGPGSLQAHFGEMFLDHPWKDRGFTSFVYEQEGAGIVGFIGVMPRPMRLAGRPIFAAVSSQFMVDTKRHRGMAGIELMKRFLAGPQELSFTDGASDAARRIWEALRGELITIYGAVWTRVLRPAGYLAERLRGRTMFRGFSWISRFSSGLLDWGAARAVKAYSAPAAPAYGEEIDEDALLKCIAGLPAKYVLRSNYDLESLRWLLGKAKSASSRGELFRILVRDSSGEPAGWYIYYAKPAAVSKVLQIGGKERTIGAVIGHLMRHAWDRGSVAVSGRIEPRFAHELSSSGCRFDFPAVSVLAHARDREILNAIQRGDAFLTRLDGEWWMRFHAEDWT